MRWFRLYLLRRQIERDIRTKHAPARKARSEAAKRGKSTEIHNRYRQMQRVFGGAL